MLVQPRDRRVFSRRQTLMHDWLSKFHTRLVANSQAPFWQEGVRVLVQPCDRRVFSNGEYSAAGAVVREDLREAAAIFGVKQVSPSRPLNPRQASVEA